MDMKRFRKLLPGAALALVLIIVLSVILASGGGRAKTSAETMAGAVEILRQMEAGDPDAVVRTIRQQQKARLAAERDELKAKLLSGEIDIWSQFQDYVMVGDSRAVGFWYYKYVPHERSLAETSATIRTMEEQIPEIVALHPGKLYISYGVNDINIGFWPTADDYVEEFVRIVDEIRAELPDVEIYVNSILEVQDWALYKGDMWKYIPDWNTVLEQMCKDHGYTFIDNSQITAEHQSEYESDGVHFKSTFYPYWGTNMVLATLYSDAEEELSE